MSPAPNPLLRLIPQVDRVLREPAVAELVERHGRGLVADAIRRSTDRLRADSGGTHATAEAVLQAIVIEVGQDLSEAGRRTLRRAINATGIVLHTGLGRAVLPQAAVEAVVDAARGHSLLEVNPETGERGQRLNHVSGLMRELTGAEDALVVNNCAAAVFLAISAMAAGREVVIARGQLVEIGGSFRIPDVIRQSGARLVEVGATNKVRLSDYASAITTDTAMLLRVHPSNFRIVGFTEEPSLAEMAELGRQHGIPVMDDLGSGALVDLTRHGVSAEPTVHASIGAGAGVVTFSADKLLGGPQAGLILGDRSLLARMKQHPLMRVLRVDKLTLAALEATLRLYRDEGQAFAQIPTLAALAATTERLHVRAESLRQILASLRCEGARERGGEGATDTAPMLSVELVEGSSQVGGGSLPGESLPTTLVSVRSSEIPTAELARRLRTGEPSVWGRIRKDRLLFDLRTITEEELPQIAQALRIALSIGKGGTHAVD